MRIRSRKAICGSLSGAPATATLSAGPQLETIMRTTSALPPSAVSFIVGSVDPPPPDAIRATILDCADVALSLTDLYGILVDVNQGACEMFGYSRGELIGRHFTAALPEAMKQSASAFHRALGSGLITF